LTTIAEKMLELKGRYNSTLPIALNKQSGNLGQLHYAVEGFFNSLGPTTRAGGTSCWSAGLDANLYDFGAMTKPDPEEMVRSKVIVLWGINPAWTAIHQMHFLERARAAGAKIVVIDPVYTATASQADLYLKVKPGSDGALALAVAKAMIDLGLADRTYLEKYVYGWPAFLEYLKNQVSPKWAETVTGLPYQAVTELAELYGRERPAAIWMGMGLQRHVNGGQNVRAINALAALTGNLGKPGAGIYYASTENWDLFSGHAAKWPQPEGNSGANRLVNINDFGRGLLKTGDPPVKMLWLAGRNPVVQDPGSRYLAEAFERLELVVLADQFLTRSARYADLFLPVTTQFEEWDVVASYWHKWIGVNQPAIAPRGEALSDLQIAARLSGVLNQLAPKSSTFPVTVDEQQWVEAQFSPQLLHLLGIQDWRELLGGCRKLNLSLVPWADGQFATPSGKYELFSVRALQKGLPPLPSFIPPHPQPQAYPFQLLTSHTQNGSNSQFQNLEWISFNNGEPALRINPAVALKLGFRDGEKVRVYNHRGEVTLPLKFSQAVTGNLLLCYQGEYLNNPVNLNDVVINEPSDLGELGTGFPGLALSDTFVNLGRI